MESIRIQIPEGFRVKSFNDRTGEISFEELPKDITEKIKTFRDALKVLDISYSEFSHSCNGLYRDEVAYKKIKLIVKALNEGWTPDWENDNQYKYYPWFKMGSPSGSGFSYLGYDYWATFSCVGSRLCFKSRKLAEYAAKQFEDIYKDFLTV